MKFFAKHTDSRWIGHLPGEVCAFQYNMKLSTRPAPYLRCEFETENISGAQLAVCGLGLHEVYLNGKKVGDHVLDPVPGIYDKNAYYVVHSAEKYLKKGRNTIGVILGNGLYNDSVTAAWLFEAASWRDLPKLRLELRGGNGKLILGSGGNWKITREGPIVYDALRNGEHYDARRELDGWNRTGYDDSKWIPAQAVRGPGGLLREQTGTPVRIVDTQELSNPNPKNVYDLGRNISGHARITVRGKAGAKIILQYAERLTPEGDIRTKELCSFPCQDGTYWQYDEYILRGTGKPEVWEARFSYYGFQYVRVRIEGEAELEKIEARIVNTDFASVGNFTSGCEIMNTLQTLTRRSYLANFVGIPTDCPHREKNGWTGDAQLASETGLCNFDAAAGYRQWIAIMRDCQRPDGALPGIVPTPGWGFNWGSGPAWDCALFVIPWNVRLYTGDDSLLKESLENMRRYLDFVDTVAEGDLMRFGLGDWCSSVEMPDPCLTNTAIYCECLRIYMNAALICGDAKEAARAEKKRRAVMKAFQKAFYRGDGVYGDGGMTALAAPLYFGLCPTETVRRAVLRNLVKLAEENHSKALFGILGAKYVPRVLAENGYAALAARFFTQKEYPGWAHWVLEGHATSLWEMWDGKASRNHIMFGDLSAWCFKYPGGFRFSEERPGFRRLTVQMCVIPEWKHFRAEYRGYETSWKCTGKGVRMQVVVPEGCAADVILPSGGREVCRTGKHCFEITEK